MSFNYRLTTCIWVYTSQQLLNSEAIRTQVLWYNLQLLSAKPINSKRCEGHDEKRKTANYREQLYKSFSHIFLEQIMSDIWVFVTIMIINQWSFAVWGAHGGLEKSHYRFVSPFVSHVFSVRQIATFQH